MKQLRHNITCLFDLWNEIILLICCYLSPCDVLYSLDTLSRPDLSLHRIIFDHYTKIKLDQITNNEYIYLSNLFCRHSKIPLQLE
jgi:hypothetical protein